MAQTEGNGRPDTEPGSECVLKSSRLNSHEFTGTISFKVTGQKSNGLLFIPAFSPRASTWWYDSELGTCILTEHVLFPTTQTCCESRRSFSGGDYFYAAFDLPESVIYSDPCPIWPREVPSVFEPEQANRSVCSWSKADTRKYTLYLVSSCSHLTLMGLVFI